MDLSGLFSYLVSLAIMGGIYAIFALGPQCAMGLYRAVQYRHRRVFRRRRLYLSIDYHSDARRSLCHLRAATHGAESPLPLGLLGAALVSGVLGLIIGLPTLRLREDYLAIATIGIAEAIRLIFNNEPWLANGPRGLTGLPQPLRSWVEPQHYNYLYLIIVLWP